MRYKYYFVHSHKKCNMNFSVSWRAISYNIFGLYVQHTQICLNVLRNIFTHIFHCIVPANKANLTQYIEGPLLLKFNQLHLHKPSKGIVLAQMWEDLMQIKWKHRLGAFFALLSHTLKKETARMCIDMLELNHLNPALLWNAWSCPLHHQLLLISSDLLSPPIQANLFK